MAEWMRLCGRGVLFCKEEAKRPGRGELPGPRSRGHSNTPGRSDGTTFHNRTPSPTRRSRVLHHDARWRPPRGGDMKAVARWTGGWDGGISTQASHASSPSPHARASLSHPSQAAIRLAAGAGVTGGRGARGCVPPCSRRPRHLAGRPPPLHPWAWGQLLQLAVPLAVRMSLGRVYWALRGPPTRY